MKKIQQLTLLTAVLLPAHVSAADFSYNYGQVSYISSDFDSIDGDGFSLDGSFELNKDVAFIASYESTSYDEPGYSLDLDVLALGIAYHMPIDQKMDAVFAGGLLDADVTESQIFSGTASDSESGNFLSAGIRVQANPQVELGLALQRYDVYDAETGIDASILFNIDQKNQVGMTFNNVGDFDNLYFRFRMNF